ncbi:D-glycero-beta-D-manno-heptose 1-phosphate adenylyltransferase [Streptomyces aidingensis]|uniref:D-glycero-beta-D-manno-heptose 1-phosphate adenylyltransferase n=1 Tax=Streptomyces aidingensis TaxID=910347 RepID=A0A1I1LIY2_9ACTN|nr:D-glycero-beta-D-manno-heptose 1-phosphate adenylyltransferase [Streptomyces aidingensis]SFC69450.1 rfaE bifunctional protein, domain II [Streptomyces aidingensis]
MTSQQPIVVVGDTLLDQDVHGDTSRLAPDAPVPVVDVAEERARPGGAGLAAALAALAVRDGREVVLVTALGDDQASETVRAVMPPGVRLVEIPLRGTLPVKTRVCVDGRPLVRVDRGDGRPGTPGDEAREVLREARAVLVADYGRATASALREELSEAARHLPLVWDPHPRGEAPVAGARLVTPNDREARTFVPDPAPGQGLAGSDSLRAHGLRGARLAERWGVASVGVTLGARGALLTRARCDDPLYVPVTRHTAGDPCGAGDCFAITAAVALADGGLPEEAVLRAVEAASAFVAAGGAGNPDTWRPRQRPPAGRGRTGGARGRVPRRLAEVLAVVESVQARGGTVVATGGCFDLLHAGHVQLLQNARRTGDCLIVCLNSDASVRRLKGPGRPLNPLADRIRVLTGLACVDAVAVFDEDTPETLLRRIRPDLWVKGGDYSVSGLPEAAALREWGGQALVLPYLAGRSTTAIARRAAGGPDSSSASAALPR